MQKVVRGMSRFSRLARFQRDSRGITAVMTAVLAPILIGFAALAIEVGEWEVHQNTMQGAADEAAWAAEMEYADAGLITAGGTNNITLVAEAVAAQHGFVAGTGGVTVTVHQPPSTGTHTSQANAVEVVITAPQTGSMSHLFLASAPTESARAVSGSSGGATCMMSLAPTGTTLSVTGSNNVSLTGCDYYNNSTSANSVVVTGSNAISARNITLAGGDSITGGSSFSASGTFTKNTNVVVTDPYASRTMPSYSGCTYSGVQTVTANKTYTTSGGVPTVFCGNLNASGSATLSFSSGVYIFDGSSLNITGSWTVNATNATLIFTSSTGLSYGTMTITGSTTLNMVAPTSGNTAGMDIWIDKNSTKSLTFTGTTTTNLTGAVYAPNATVTMSGSGTSTCTQLIAAKLTLTGSSTLKHQCTGVGVSDVGGVSLLE